MADITSVSTFFNETMRHVVANPEKSAGMNATYQFNITGEDGGQWYAELNDGTGKVTEGTVDDPHCTVTAGDEDWLKIVNGQLNPQIAFMQGKIKVQGNMGLALKLQNFLRD